MTGATSGLGKIAACKMANQGATLVVTCRNEKKGEQLLEFYNSNYVDKMGAIDIVACDLADLSSIVLACEVVKQKYDQLDMIVNNAGIMNFSRKETGNGIEETWQVNLLAPILITHLLLNLLEKTTDAKLIYTSSALHKGTINFDDIEFKQKFSSYKSYQQSKLGLILFTRFFADKMEQNNIGIYTQHPGMVNTDLGRSAGFLSKFIFKMMGTSPEKGAENLLFLANAPKSSLENGGYYANKKITETTKESYDLILAEQMMEQVKRYLSSYINTKSLLFDVAQTKWC